MGEDRERAPYLQVELDAIHKAEQVARAARAQGHQLSRNDVVGGLLDLWEGCWRRKSSRVTELTVLGCFGAQIIPILMEFGFLAAEDGAFRCKGAGKYLHLEEGRIKGGHAAKTNLIPGPHKKARRESQPEANFSGCSPAEPSEPEGEPEEISPAHIPALSGISSSQQSAVSIQQSAVKDSASAQSATAAPRASRKETGESSTTGIRHQAIVAALYRVFEEVTGHPYEKQGRDWRAISLMADGNLPIEELSRRWKVALNAKGFTKPVAIWDFQSKLNGYANENGTGPPKDITKGYAPSGTWTEKDYADFDAVTAGAGAEVHRG